MGVVYQPGQELDENDLKIFFRDRDGLPMTTLLVKYTILYYDCCTLVWDPISDTYPLDATASVTPGKWWVDWAIPAGQNVGPYQVQWQFRETALLPWQMTKMTFGIVHYCTTSPVRTAEVSDLPDTPIVIVR